ncbi:hypothetical protein K0504_01340 [Neiella marina]|uniref:Uncharacterized protein n=1 Tax=Neiella holothuriorum TaxID=2870530 RepID=A0ABS7EBQ2_9GAMM|nr:hypothetical protein [Neiella holothuriorum]MBW8189665.1 hypothetical protein [Neiella holothuriorum]
MAMLDHTQLKLGGSMGLLAILLGVALLCMLGFYKHIDYFNQLTASLARRGFNMAKFSTSYFDFGSKGCLKKLRKIESIFHGNFTNQERALVSKCRWAFRLQVIPIMLLLGSTALALIES